MVGSWESSIEGEVIKWDSSLRAGMVVERKYAGLALFSILWYPWLVRKLTWIGNL